MAADSLFSSMLYSFRCCHYYTSSNCPYEKVGDGEPVCIADEVPFELPDGWEWARLGDLGKYQKGPFGSSLTKAMFVPDASNAFKVYEQKNAIRKDASLGHYYISPEKFIELSNFEVFPGDIIVSCAGTIGEAFVIPEVARRGIINQALMRISLYVQAIQRFYLVYFDYVLKTQAGEASKGTALKNIPPFAVLKQFLIPIPPLAEQQRIVVALDEYLALVDEVERNQEELEELLAKARSKVLDLAIRGKLVPQDPTDEPASMLLERIREEKLQMVAEGKLKKKDIARDSVIYKGEDNSYYEKVGDAEPVCIADEVPFELPDGWERVNLFTLIDSNCVGDGDWILSENMDEVGPVRLIQLGNIGNCKYIEKGYKYLSWDTYNNLKCTPVYPGYLLISRLTVAGLNCCIIPKSIGGDFITAVDVCWIAPRDKRFCLEYLMYAVSSPVFQAKAKLLEKGSTRKRISKNNLFSIHIPVPPLAEQERIVVAIEKLLPLLKIEGI